MLSSWVYLNAKITTINVVSEEEVAGLGRITTDFEQLHQIVVLAMNVAADGDGGVHLEHVGFGAEDLGAFFYDPKRLLFRQTTLTLEMALEKVDIGLGVIERRQELLLGRRDEGRCLDV
jgi:hypothetical protein